MTTVDSHSLAEMVSRYPVLQANADQILASAQLVIESQNRGGTLFLAGNGGSFADCLHIGGELKKSFEKPRPLGVQVVARLKSLPGGEELANNLHAGLRTVVLGLDPVLSSATDNDINVRFAQFAQELMAMGRKGDVLLGISTSGRSKNVLNAALVAKALEISIIVFTGESQSPLSEIAEISVHAPARATAEVQGLHSHLYHTWCRIIEDTLYPLDEGTNRTDA